MKEYTIRATETTAGYFYIRATSEQEALQKFEEMTRDGGYRDMMEDVESFSAEIADYQVIDGTEIETTYAPDTDMTIIIQYTYQNCRVVAEQIIGFYHGEPNDEDTAYYAGKGTVATMF